ncbi:FAD-dependent oxidoreductase [Roseivirga sp. 4D4]|uniref:NAD(P)/FAD-dependent oxidoreductase n=1 Tax=Roseivirga sp. 4D4 TaxID=1889784 RepID=UPI000853AE75|nr:FAD-dependent oxidoreductase [Roseivirga sp. 4D4]OEK00223.1 FAD-dependent oxidoreductase [Roseivirga sp. 4D4]
MLSFWEKDEFLNYDHVVVGGGIVGLSTAISIKERDSKAKVLVLEQGTFPTGASTKNAGFACFGSLTEILADLRGLPESEVFNLVKLRWEGLQLLRARVGDDGLDYQNLGGYELLRSSDMGAFQEMNRINEMLMPLFGEAVYHDSSAKINQLGFSPSVVKGLVFNPFEAQLHSGKMMKSLTRLATDLGVEILTGTSVSQFDEDSNGVSVHTTSDITFHARKLAICTNAFSKSLLPNTDLVPGRGVVLVTKPIAGLKFKGTFHYDEGYYYFRNYQDRILFGGGRNLDVTGEETTVFEVRDLILEKLKSDLNEVIIPGQDFEIDHIWSGIMAFGPNKQPILESHSDNVHIGVRLGGMGVAIGSKMGFELAELMLR